ncbi:cupredoxin domain-containing protein [Candidatus Parcubacteria bacterium]|nr:cupredoxin domain-containing protein [Candidatus Parcubacteria bacterium]
MNKSVIIILIIAIVGIGGYLLFSGKKASNIPSDSTQSVDTMPDMTDTGNQTPDTGNVTGGNTSGGNTSGGNTTGTTAQVKSFTVTGGSNFRFTPTTLTVNKGDTVTIKFVNSGGMHDWRIDEFNVTTKVIQSGQTDSVTFVANKTGSFEYYCSVGTHRQMGMKGTLTVL